MANKGLTFDGIDDPKIPASIRRRRPERVEAWIADQEERFAIVDTCTRCKPTHPLIAAELEPHRLSHIKNTRAREIIGMLLHPKTSAATLAEVRSFLETM